MDIRNKTKPLVLITRPYEDALPLAEQLQELEYDVWIEPMIEVDIKFNQMESLATLMDKPPQAIIITSANGLRSLSALSSERDVPLITVGPASYEESIRLGYNYIAMADSRYGGDVNGLIRYITEHYSPEDGMILHASSKNIAGDLMTGLKDVNFIASHIELYDAHAAMGLSTTICDAIDKQEIGLVLFYSPRTASIFVNLIKEHRLAELMKPIECFCLSQNVADTITELPFKKCHVAKKPTQDAMLSLLKRND